jgi:hypothetical protein
MAEMMGIRRETYGRWEYEGRGDLWGAIKALGLFDAARDEWHRLRGFVGSDILEEFFG